MQVKGDVWAATYALIRFGGDEKLLIYKEATWGFRVPPTTGPQLNAMSNPLLVNQVVDIHAIISSGGQHRNLDIIRGTAQTPQFSKCIQQYGGTIYPSSALECVLHVIKQYRTRLFHCRSWRSRSSKNFLDVLVLQQEIKPPSIHTHI